MTCRSSIIESGKQGNFQNMICQISQNYWYHRIQGLVESS